MPLRTSSDAAPQPRSLRRAPLIALLLAAPLSALLLNAAPAAHATAQVYIWRDATGTVHFSPAR